MKKYNFYLFALILPSVLSGCASKSELERNQLIIDPEEYIATPFEHKKMLSKECFNDPKNSRNIAIFFDGTANAESSETNIVKLRNLATMQSMSNEECPRNYVLYVKGVGTEGNFLKKIIGSGLGAGIGKDVRQAYRYLSQYYRGPQDNIYLFGFSRGAASARILNSFISVAGLPKLSGSIGAMSKKRSQALYDMYKGDESMKEKKNEFTKSEMIKNHQYPEIAFLGLFDTVSALGITHFGQNKGQLNNHYSENICNVKRIAHAVSIDDNRASVFTPALLHKGLLDLCQHKQDVFLDFVDQVWFSGAHADVGGGYLDTDLSGVALNWMIERVNYADALNSCFKEEDKPTYTSLFEHDSSTYEDYLGLSHDAESHMSFVPNRSRNWPVILNGNISPSNDELKSSRLYVDAGISAPTLHASVKERLAIKPKECRDFNWINDTDGFTKNYKQCFNIKNDIDLDSIKSLSYCTNDDHKPIYVIELKTEDEAVNGSPCPTIWERPSLPVACQN